MKDVRHIHNTIKMQRHDVLVMTMKCKHSLIEIRFKHLIFDYKLYKKDNVEPTNIIIEYQGILVIS